jgi:hypothetical protein
MQDNTLGYFLVGIHLEKFRCLRDLGAFRRI